MAIVDGHIRCSDCGETKPVADYYRSTIAKGCGRCRDCSKAAYRASVKADPARFKEYRKASARRHPDAAKSAAKKSKQKKLSAYAQRGPSKEVIRCSTCRQEKPVAMFGPSVAAMGCGQCRACKYERKREYERRNASKVAATARARRARDPGARRAVQRAYYDKNRAAHRAWALQSRYGIASADYEAMLAAQGGVCACCGASANRNGKKLFVDHDHATGAVRGILCHKCNAGIGALGDTADGVRRALNYLERAQQSPPQRAAPALRINLLQGAN